VNQLFYGDNLRILRNDIRDESVDLIYLDPPFNSKRSYNILFQHKSGEQAQGQIQAFDDTWIWSQESEELFGDLVGGGAPAKVADAIQAMRRLLGENDVLAYLVMMTARLVELHRVLKPTGSLYLHCDPTASHYLKIVLDAIFGPKQFQNEVIWHYRGAGVSPRRWGRRHDVILFYAKGDTWTFNVDPVREPYSEASMERLKYKAKAFRGDKVYDNYEPNAGGKHPDDVFHMQPIMPSDKRRLGYPTQKPLELLERILLASSNEGDVVLDPFAGCGTTIDAAHKLQRRWIGIDITYLAIDLIEKRLRATYGDEVRDTYELRGVPRELEGAQALFDANAFDFERWAVTMVNGEPNEKQVGDKGIDGRIRFYLNEKRETGEVLVSVKGGAQLNPGMVRDLRGTVERQGAAMGVFLCMGTPTRGMVEEAQHSGSYVYDFSGASFPKIQILTVAELLHGKRPAMPTPILPYRLAKKRSGQMDLLGGL
jgi:DNA modification methylase